MREPVMRPWQWGMLVAEQHSTRQSESLRWLMPIKPIEIGTLFWQQSMQGELSPEACKRSVSLPPTRYDRSFPHSSKFWTLISENAVNRFGHFQRGIVADCQLEFSALF
jgi:hypothetical protein